MAPEQINNLIETYYSEETRKNGYIYIYNYFSSKSLSEANVSKILQEVLDADIKTINEEDKTEVLEILEENVVIHEIDEERWILIYDSSLPSGIRKKLSTLSQRIGWLLEGWARGEVIDDLYREYAPDDEKVRIKKEWDPYWVYDKGSEIPTELQAYFDENSDKFEEREVEFSIKTPKKMLGEVLNSSIEEELREKSETSQSKFEFVLPNPGVANLTLTRHGGVTHRSGNTKATVKAFGRIDEDIRSLRQEFEPIIPEKDYKSFESGIKRVSSYSPSKVLKLRFEERRFDEESSITLSNLLTVGQNDVELYGTILWREDKEFVAETRISYDGSEYEIYFTSEDSRPVLYIEPVSGTVSGLIYLFKKLKEKFDPRIERDILKSSEIEGNPEWGSGSPNNVAGAGDKSGEVS
jgi:hypothetical protein